MSEIRTVTFVPAHGKTVELPEEIGRSDIGRYGGGTRGNGRLEIAVVGRGDLSEHVVLEASEGVEDIPDNSKILGTDVAQSSTYYTVEREEYNG